MNTLTIGIGFDQKEAVAWHTLTHSILSRSSVPISFIPIKRSLLTEVHDRPMHEKQSNDFSFTRFLLPYLCNYEGWSIFMDCDMLVRTDIRKLFELRDDRYAVMCVKHDYTPKDETKYLGTIQYKYEKKNWSSVMLMNNEKCRMLTPGYVNTATGLELHQFKWLHDQDLIGALPVEWNHLVLEYPPNPEAKNVHFTNFGPWLNSHGYVEHSEAWYKERMNMTHCDQKD